VSEFLDNMQAVQRGGEGLGISCQYPVEVYGLPGDDFIRWDEMTDHGFDRPTDGPPMIDQHGVAHDINEMLIAVLRDDDGVVVATWDEGRWWTPAESDAFVATLTNPLMRQMAEATAMNREQRRRKK
jgi:Fe-S cluster assembly ATPase SufC